MEIQNVLTLGTLGAVLMLCAFVILDFLEYRQFLGGYVLPSTNEKKIGFGIKQRLVSDFLEIIWLL